MGQHLRRFVVGQAVEVAGDDGGHRRGDGFQAVHNEAHPLAAGFGAHMVQVRIEISHLAAVLLVLQQGPGADAVARGAPAFDAKLIGRGAEREVARTQQFEAVGAEEDGAELAFGLAVFAAHAEGGVLRQHLFQGCHLLGQHFLHAQQVGGIVAQHPAYFGTAVGPGVQAVRLGVEADVEGHDVHRLGSVGGFRPATAQEEQGGEKGDE